LEPNNIVQIFQGHRIAEIFMPYSV